MTAPNPCAWFDVVLTVVFPPEMVESVIVRRWPAVRRAIALP